MTDTTATDASTQREVGKGSATLMPDRYKDRSVVVARDIPGIVVLVHGVNDLGVSYYAMDNGLCQGLNERLNRNDMFPNDFILPKDDDPTQKDPDKIYFRRTVNANTQSPVIPFYWGYRAAADELGKEEINHQVVDIHGNRLDKDFAKGGGMFVNATNNIPDMFSGNYRDNLANKIPKMGSDVAHPLLEGADRRYMALAAKRLAALVKQIRCVHPDETVTLIGHSQGCLISLLAQAYLLEGARAADCLILCHPPYGINEPWLERFAQAGEEQQTTAARIKTLANLVKAVTDNQHSSPDLNELNDPNKGMGRAGPAWTPVGGARAGLDDSEATHTFVERDNRGKVYLYFCPHDLTVGLANIEGIGTFGVPDHIDTDDQNGRKVKQPVLSELGKCFMQRVWTWRARNGQPVSVGDPDMATFVMRMEKEPGYDSKWGERLMRARANVGEARQINAEPLSPPWKPFLHFGEAHIQPDAEGRDRETAHENENQGYVGKQSIDPIDAAIAVSNQRKTGLSKDEALAAQAKYRQASLPNSYHSSIVANPAHHRWVTAMDVAIGQAKTLDDPDWRETLLAIADWRSNIEQKTPPKFEQLDSEVKQLVEATWKYYKKGEFPSELVPRTPPAQVANETRKMRAQAQGVKA